MKKSVIVMWIVAALFLVSAFPMFAEGNVGAGVSGIAIAAALAAFGFVKSKKAKDGAPAASAEKRVEAPAARGASVNSTPAAEPELPFEFLKTNIAGVTFKDGRKSRQTILRRLYWKDAPFDHEEAEVTLVREEFEGKPAFAVMLNGEKAGYVPAEHVQYISDNYERCDGVTRIEAHCGKEDIYGAEITIRFRKV